MSPSRRGGRGQGTNRGGRYLQPPLVPSIYPQQPAPLWVPFSGVPQYPPSPGYQPMVAVDMNLPSSHDFNNGSSIYHQPPLRYSQTTPNFMAMPGVHGVHGVHGVPFGRGGAPFQSYSSPQQGRYGNRARRFGGGRNGTRRNEAPGWSPTRGDDDCARTGPQNESPDGRDLLVVTRHQWGLANHSLEELSKQSALISDLRREVEVLSDFRKETLKIREMNKSWRQLPVVSAENDRIFEKHLANFASRNGPSRSRERRPTYPGSTAPDVTIFDGHFKKSFNAVPKSSLGHTISPLASNAPGNGHKTIPGCPAAVEHHTANTHRTRREMEDHAPTRGRDANREILTPPLVPHTKTSSYSSVLIGNTALEATGGSKPAEVKSDIQEYPTCRAVGVKAEDARHQVCKVPFIRKQESTATTIGQASHEPQKPVDTEFPQPANNLRPVTNASGCHPVSPLPTFDGSSIGCRPVAFAFNPEARDFCFAQNASDTSPKSQNNRNGHPSTSQSPTSFEDAKFPYLENCQEDVASQMTYSCSQSSTTSQYLPLCPQEDTQKHASQIYTGTAYYQTPSYTGHLEPVNYGGSVYGHGTYDQVMLGVTGTEQTRYTPSALQERPYDPEVYAQDDYIHDLYGEGLYTTNGYAQGQYIVDRYDQTPFQPFGWQDPVLAPVEAPASVSAADRRATTNIKLSAVEEDTAIQEVKGDHGENEKEVASRLEAAEREILTYAMEPLDPGPDSRPIPPKPSRILSWADDSEDEDFFVPPKAPSIPPVLITESDVEWCNSSVISEGPNQEREGSPQIPEPVATISLPLEDISLEVEESSLQLQPDEETGYSMEMSGICKMILKVPDDRSTPVEAVVGETAVADEQAAVACPAVAAVWLPELHIAKDSRNHIAVDAAVSQEAPDITSIFNRIPGGLSSLKMPSAPPPILTSRTTPVEQAPTVLQLSTSHTTVSSPSSDLKSEPEEEQWVTVDRSSKPQRHSKASMKPIASGSTSRAHQQASPISSWARIAAASPAMRATAPVVSEPSGQQPAHMATHPLVTIASPSAGPGTGGHRKLYINDVPTGTSYAELLSHMKGGLIDDIFVSGLSPDFQLHHQAKTGKPAKDTEAVWFAYVTFFSEQGAMNCIKYLNAIDPPRTPVNSNVPPHLRPVAHVTLSGTRVPIYMRERDQRPIQPDVVEAVTKLHGTRVLQFAFKKNIRLRSPHTGSKSNWQIWQKAFTQDNGQEALEMLRRYIQVFSGTPFIYTEKIDLLPPETPFPPNQQQLKASKLFPGALSDQIFHVRIAFLRISISRKVMEVLERDVMFKDHCKISFAPDHCAEIIEMPAQLPNDIPSEGSSTKVEIATLGVHRTAGKRGKKKKPVITTPVIEDPEAFPPLPGKNIRSGSPAPSRGPAAVWTGRDLPLPLLSLAGSTSGEPPAAVPDSKITAVLTAIEQVEDSLVLREEFALPSLSSGRVMPIFGDLGVVEVGHASRGVDMPARRSPPWTR